MSGLRRPSALSRLLLKLLVPRRYRDFFLDDLDELFGRERERFAASTRRGPVQQRRSLVREIAGALQLRFDLPPSAPDPSRAKGKQMLSGLFQDLRLSLRLLVGNPGFTMVALLTMTLGIGANTAMFSLVHGVLLKPLPYPEAERIVYLRETNEGRGLASVNVSPPNFWDWEEGNRSMDLMAAFRATTVTYTGGRFSETLSGLQVSESYLEILGAEPVLGRGFSQEDLDPTGEPVVILGHGFWERAFGEDPGALGGVMVLNGANHTVVGVLPEAWQPVPPRADVLLPLVRDPSWATRRSSRFLTVLGRLSPGISPGQAQSDMASVAAGLARAFPDANEGYGVSVRRLEEVMVESSRSQLLILLGVTGMVLLIALANLANMTLARASSRGREFAIRTALGAGRGRVVRQLLVESISLALVGAGLGVALARVAVGGFVSTWPDLLPRLSGVGINGPVLVFSVSLALGSGIVFGLAPAVLVSQSRSSAALREGVRTLTQGSAGRWMRRVLVVSEVALAVVLLTGSGLLLKSFSALRGESPGFSTEGRLVFNTRIPTWREVSPDGIRAFVEEAVDRLTGLPGVEAVGVTNLVPITGDNEIYDISFDGRPPEASSGISAILYRISSDYVGTMGIPLLAGREIGRQDRAGGTPVAMVTQSFAETNYPGQDPLGQRIRFGGNPVWFEIVGVVGDVHHFELGRESLAQIYLPFNQEPTKRINFVVRASVPTMNLIQGVREAIADVDPNQPVANIRPVEELISQSISLSRIRTALMAGFALSALLLAIAGLYGIVAYDTSQRSREMGIRIALGADRNSILGLALREGMTLVGVGLTLGLGAAFGLTGVLQSLLFEVGERDPMVFSSVPLILVAVALAAMLMPALRAVSLDPVRTLGEG